MHVLFGWVNHNNNDNKNGMFKIISKIRTVVSFEIKCTR